MTDPVRVALIGTGRWGQRIAEAVGRTPLLELVTCYSRDTQRRSAFAAEVGCRAADTFEQALSDVDGVLLITPNHVHAAQTEACAQAGLGVFVEKPIAYSLDDARRMEEACRQAGVPLMVGHGFRRLGAARRVAELVAEETLGRVVLAEANFSLPAKLTPDAWRFYRETCPGGPLMQLGIHHVDTLMSWLGPVSTVRGSFARLATTAEIDDVGVVVMEFASGARGVVTSSYVSPRTLTIRLFGTEGIVEYVTDMSVWPQAEKVDSATTLTLRRDGGSEALVFDERDILVEELEEFAACVRGERQAETGAAEGTAALAVILAALRSHEEGRVVSPQSS